jgi:hypothetical protein
MAAQLVNLANLHAAGDDRNHETAQLTAGAGNKLENHAPVLIPSNPRH